MVKPSVHTEGYQARNCQNTKQLALWTGAWLTTLALATFGPVFLWSDKMLSVVFILINFLFGIVMIAANKRHFDGLDELQRKIQLDATAITCGVAIVAGLSWSLLDITNVVDFKAEISHLVMLMGLTYGTSVFVGSRKYA